MLNSLCVFSSALCSKFTAISVVMLSLSTSTNVEIGVVDFGGTLGEVKVNVNVLGELQKLVDGCLPLIPLMVS